MGRTGPHAAAAIGSVDRLGALGNRVADAVYGPAARHDSRLRWISARALQDQLYGARRPGRRSARSSVAELQRVVSYGKRLPRPRPRSMGAVAPHLSECRRAGGAGVDSTVTRCCAPLAPRRGFGAAVTRRRAGYRVGTHHAQPARLDGGSAPPRFEISGRRRGRRLRGRVS